MTDKTAETKEADPAKASTEGANISADKKTDDTSAGPYRPEGMPDHYAGKDEKETIDKLYKTLSGFRKDLSKDKGIPEKIEDYNIELPEEVSKVILKPGDDGKDPTWEHMRSVFHSRGYSAEDAAAIVTEFVSKLSLSGDTSPVGDEASAADFDYKSLGGVEKAQPIVEGATVFLQGLKNSGKLSDKAVEELSLLTFHSQGLQALNELRPLLGDKAIPITIEGSNSGSGTKTQEQLNEMMKDPRYWKPGVKSEEYIAEVTKGFQALYNPKTES